MKKEEFKDILGAKSYVEAVVGARREYDNQGHNGKEET